MRRVALACIAVSSLLAGCLGRTGLSIEDLEAYDDFDAAVGDAGPDGIVIVEGGTDGAVVEDSSTPVDSAVDTRPDGYIDIWDVIPIPEGGVIGECAGCMRDNCGTQVNDCINSAACRNGMACVVTKCLASAGGGGGTGGFDLKCVTDCFKGDYATASLAISTFTCVIGKCGSKCAAFLGGSGGIPGLPGGGSGGGSGGSGGGFPGGGAMPSFSAEELPKLDPSIRFCFSPEAFEPWRDVLAKAACEQGLASCE